MSRIKYEKPVLQTKPLFKSPGQVDLDVFYIAMQVIDEEKWIGMYKSELEAVMADREE
jgi:hypothetical protein